MEELRGKEIKRPPQLVNSSTHKLITIKIITFKEKK